MRKSCSWAVALLAVLAAPAAAQRSADDARRVADLVLANRILAAQGVVDGFGHVSVRSAANPARMFIARSLAPELVTAADVVEVDVQRCEPADPKAPRTYLERFIHCSIYRATPAIQSVVHNHSPALIPFGVTGQTLRPVYHMSAFLGAGAPLFEIRDAGGNATDMLIRDARLGDALAASLGRASMVLMRGHGATAVGNSIPQAVYRAIYAEKNAALQVDAMRLGTVSYLNIEESRRAAATNDEQVGRPWALWAAHAGREGKTAP